MKEVAQAIEVEYEQGGVVACKVATLPTTEEVMEEADDGGDRT